MGSLSHEDKGLSSSLASCDMIVISFLRKGCTTTSTVNIVDMITVERIFLAEKLGQRRICAHLQFPLCLLLDLHTYGFPKLLMVIDRS